MNTLALLLSLLFILCLNAEEAKTGGKKARKFAKENASYGGERKKATCEGGTKMDLSTKSQIRFDGCDGRKLSFKLKFKIREIVCGEKSKTSVQYGNLDTSTVDWVQNDQGENLKGKKVTANVNIPGSKVAAPVVTFAAYRVAKDFSDDNGEHIEGDIKWNFSIKNWPWKDRTKNCLKFCVGYSVKDKEGRKRSRPDDKKGTKEDADSAGKVRFWQKFSDFAIESPDGVKCGGKAIKTVVVPSNDENDDETDSTTKADSDKAGGRLRTCYQFKPCPEVADELMYDPEIADESGDAASVAGMLARGNLLIGLLVAAFYFF